MTPNWPKCRARWGSYRCQEPLGHKVTDDGTGVHRDGHTIWNHKTDWVGRRSIRYTRYKRWARRLAALLVLVVLLLIFSMGMVQFVYWVAPWPDEQVSDGFTVAWGVCIVAYGISVFRGLRR